MSEGYTTVNVVQLPRLEEEDLSAVKEQVATQLFGQDAFKPNSSRKMLTEVNTLLDSWISNLWRAFAKKVERDRIAMEKLEVEVQETLESMCPDRE